MKRTLLWLFAFLFICGTAYSQDKVKTKKQKAATDTLARSGVDGDTYSDVSEGQGDEEEGGGNYVLGLLH